MLINSLVDVNKYTCRTMCLLLVYIMCIYAAGITKNTILTLTFSKKLNKRHAYKFVFYLQLFKKQNKCLINCNLCIYCMCATYTIMANDNSLNALSPKKTDTFIVIFFINDLSSNE